VRRAPDTELGDPFESLYREHAERLWRAVLAYAQDREVASDAVAEAFAQCLQRGPAVRDPGRWVWRAAFRIAAGELKERRMRTVIEDVPEVGERTEELLSSLAMLPPRQRAVLVLHYYAGYKAREIAAIVGSTAATVRVHLSQGRKRLRSLLETDDE
jgi:RNA polymerase sigma factor (sigma-70 family)